MTQEEMAVKVLGKRSGYLKGYGHGPKPPSSKRSYTAPRENEEEVEVLKDQISMLTEKGQKQDEKIAEYDEKIAEYDEKIAKYDDKMAEYNQKFEAQNKEIEELKHFMRMYMMQGGGGGASLYRYVFFELCT